MGSEEDDEDDDEIIPAAARSELPMRGLSRDSSLSGSSSRDISSKVIEKKEKILTRDTIVTMVNTHAFSILLTREILSCFEYIIIYMNY